LQATGRGRDEKFAKDSCGPPLAAAFPEKCGSLRDELLSFGCREHAAR